MNFRRTAAVFFYCAKELWSDIDTIVVMSAAVVKVHLLIVSWGTPFPNRGRRPFSKSQVFSEKKPKKFLKKAKICRNQTLALVFFLKKNKQLILLRRKKSIFQILEESKYSTDKKFPFRHIQGLLILVTLSRVKHVAPHLPAYGKRCSM